MTIIHLGTQILPEFAYVKDGGNSVERLHPNHQGRPIVLTEFSVEAFVKLYSELSAWRAQEEAKRAMPAEPPQEGKEAG